MLVQIIIKKDLTWDLNLVGSNAAAADDDGDGMVEVMFVVCVDDPGTICTYHTKSPLFNLNCSFGGVCRLYTKQVDKEH